MSTDSEWYARRLKQKQGQRWKKILRVQAPYQWNLRRKGLVGASTSAVVWAAT